MTPCPIIYFHNPLLALRAITTCFTMYLATSVFSFIVTSYLNTLTYGTVSQTGGFSNVSQVIILYKWIEGLNDRVLG